MRALQSGRRLVGSADIYQLRMLTREHGVMDEPSAPVSYVSKRQARCAIYTILSIVVLFFLFKSYPDSSHLSTNRDTRLFAPTQNARLPSLFSRIHEHEVQQSQIIPGLESSLEESRRYLFVQSPVHRMGWGNVMQELLLNFYLAYRSGRSYVSSPPVQGPRRSQLTSFVYDNYTWYEDGWLDYVNSNEISTGVGIPLSALIRGISRALSVFSLLFTSSRLQVP